jgi:membrane associated rhomboid family serine protease
MVDAERGAVRPGAAGSGTGAGADAEEILAEARKAFFVMFGFLVVVWAVQLVNWEDGYALSRQYGLLSGDVGRLPDVVTAPLLHWSWAHIESNSGPLFVFGFLAAYRGVARFLTLTLLVAMTSGLAVWFFERGGADTVGASGLIFGYFGYVVVRGVFDRHLIDTLVGVVMGGSFAYLLTIAVPGTPGVSWLAHLGGLLGGVLGAWLLRDRTAARARRRDPDHDRRPPRTPGPGGSRPLPAPRPDPAHPRADLHKELGDLGLL